MTTEVGKNYMTPELQEKTNKTQMSVYSALNKRKVYSNRLEKLKDGHISLFSVVQKSAQDINGLSREDYEKKVKSSYDSYIAILRNFYALNAAITESNAKTRITIAGVEYSVAEAIVRYDRSNAEAEFLSNIASKVAHAQATLSRNNAEKLSEKAINDYVNKTMETINLEGIENQEEVINNLREKYRKDYIDRNTYELIDPYNHAETIEERINELNEFISEFNEALNICNMQTIIEVDLIN
jgi:hypothetical protein